MNRWYVCAIYSLTIIVTGALYVCLMDTLLVHAADTASTYHHQFVY